MSAATDSNSASRRAANTTAAPSMANIVAIPDPIPDEAPVTTPTRPSNTPLPDRSRSAVVTGTGWPLDVRRANGTLHVFGHPAMSFRAARSLAETSRR